MSKKGYIVMTIAASFLTLVLSSCSTIKYEPENLYAEHIAEDYEKSLSVFSEHGSENINEDKEVNIDIFNSFEGSLEYIESNEYIDEAGADTVLEEESADEAYKSAEAPEANEASALISFTKHEISDDIFLRIQGKSYSEGCIVKLSELRYIKVLHYGFDGKVHEGELIVNEKIADDIIEIFKELYEAEYPIEKMVLIDEYDADDDLSMEDNNTSSFNYRLINGSSTLSNHSYGMAVDINPLYNPYIKEKDGSMLILPENAEAYTDRQKECEYYIKKGDSCYNAFIKRGFTWGGEWQSVKDYQHFEKR